MLARLEILSRISKLKYRNDFFKRKVITILSIDLT